MELNYILVILMFLSFIMFLMTGIPIAYVLGGLAVFFCFLSQFLDLVAGTDLGLDYYTLGMVINRVFKLMENWVLVAIPMFVFMGLMLDHSGIAQRMMYAMQELFGRVRGGLAITVALIGIIMAASTGIIGASVVLLTVLSVPIMLDQGYDRSLSLGTVAASGTLGILIPPSIMLVIMADQLSISVGDLFMGAMVPGLILGAGYILYILMYGLIRPEKCPLPANQLSPDVRIVLRVLRTVMAPASLVLMVLGSIFLGVATPTEASGVGAAGATFLAGVNRKLNWQVIRQVAVDTYKTTGYIFGIFLAANAFALVLRMLGGDDLVEGALTGLPFGPYGVAATILIAVFLLGFFLDWIEISLIILPLLTPVIAGLDLNVNGFGVLENPKLVWFTILIALTLQTSFLTPPVGFAIFFMQGVLPKNITLLDSYKGVVPFVIIQLIGLFIVAAFPGLVTWLPAMIYK